MPKTKQLITSMCSRNIACTTPGRNLSQGCFSISNLSIVQILFSVVTSASQLWKSWIAVTKIFPKFKQVFHQQLAIINFGKVITLLKQYNLINKSYKKYDA